MNSSKITAAFFTALISMNGFFLYMSYLKLDRIADNVQALQTGSAVKEEQLKNIAQRLTALENTVSIYPQTK